MSKKMSFKKVNAEIIKLGENESFIGKLTQLSDREWFDKEKGELTTIKQFHFDILNDEGELTGKGIYFGDGGFQNAISMAGISVGDTIQVEKHEKQELKGGRRVNNYSIYKAE